MIEVVNIYDLDFDWRNDDNYLYIGRGSPWGNPFVIGVDGSRIEVIQQYSQYAINTQYFHDAITEFVFCDKKLVCYCAPNNCHGDFLKYWQDSYVENLCDISQLN